MGADRVVADLWNGAFDCKEFEEGVEEGVGRSATKFSKIPESRLLVDILQPPNFTVFIAQLQ
jgi:hypothetical protein